MSVPLKRKVDFSVQNQNLKSFGLKLSAENQKKKKIDSEVMWQCLRGVVSILPHTSTVLHVLGALDGLHLLWCSMFCSFH